MTHLIYILAGMGFLLVMALLLVGLFFVGYGLVEVIGVKPLTIFLIAIVALWVCHGVGRGVFFPEN